MNFKFRRVFLPEFFHIHRDSAGHIAEKSEAQRAFAFGDVQPRTFGLRAFLDDKALRVGLREFVVVPVGDVVDELLLRRGILIRVGNPLAGKLDGEHIAQVAGSNHAPANERLDRLRPHSFIAAETNVAVNDFFAQRHGERNRQAFDEIILAVAVVNECMNDSDRIFAGAEIEPDNERQPGAVGRGGFVIAFDLHDRPDRALLFQSDGS